MKITTVVTGILVTLIFNIVQCTLVTKPSHAAAKIGDFVIMRCSSSYVDETCGGIKWKYFQSKSSSGTYINDKDTLITSVASHISIINSSAGNCDLRINATVLTGGRYQCINSNPEEATAEMITIDPKVCEQSHDNMATTKLECSVRYYGNWVPKVQWMKTSEDSLDIAASNDNETSKNPVSSTITIGTTEQFKCRVRVFEPGKPNILIFDWLSRPYSLKNCTYPCSEDQRAYNKGIGVGFAICLAIFCLIGITFLIFKRWQRRCIKGKGRNPPAEDL